MHRPTFWTDDSGAVTVDWVVLSAAILGIGLLVVMPVAYSTGSMAQFTADMISSLKVGQTEH